ncbi:MAG TPA: FAD-dependent oxidoreductase, partial [Gemmatimonadales bacterium]|nr:FAD-dependent oxidoreductase [Gemmatimonadales bacterium]
WDAALRGLSVALVDQGDFGAGTSANSLRIVHGGLRYLARGDFARMRESIRERSALLRIAPGLVTPLPVLIPTYRHRLRGRPAMGLALLLNELVSPGRNRGLSPDRAIPAGHLIGRDECLRLFPWFSRQGLTGGALWYDARLLHPERLTFSFVSSAAARGAVAANYVRVDRLQVRRGKIEGASAADLVGGARFDIRSRAVVVAAGPWTSELVAGTLGEGGNRPKTRYALAVNAVLERKLADLAVGCQVVSNPDTDPIGGGGRYLFAAPQGQRALLGTWYGAAGESPGKVESGVRTLVREFNEVCPGLELSLRDVAEGQWGLLPLKGSDEPGRPTALAERPRLTDYPGQVQGLLSVEGVKYTTARRVAEDAVNWVFRSLDRTSPRCRTAEVRLQSAGAPDPLSWEGASVEAGVHRAVREEMAVKLSDIVFRRSTLGTAGRLTRARLVEIARLAAAELGWNALRQQTEIEEVMQRAAAAPAEEPVV